MNSGIVKLSDESKLASVFNGGNQSAVVNVLAVAREQELRRLLEVCELDVKKDREALEKADREFNVVAEADYKAQATEAFAPLFALAKKMGLPPAKEQHIVLPRECSYGWADAGTVTINFGRPKENSSLSLRAPFKVKKHGAGYLAASAKKEAAEKQVADTLRRLGNIQRMLRDQDSMRRQAEAQLALNGASAEDRAALKAMVQDVLTDVAKQVG